MTCGTVKTQQRRLLPPLSPEEQKTLASAIIKDTMAMFNGKAGASLVITDADGNTLTARSKPLEVVSFRMAQYNQCPALFRSFVFRHDGDLFDKLRAYYADTFPECMEV